MSRLVVWLLYFAYAIGLWILGLMVIGVFVHRRTPGELGPEGGIVLAIIPAHNEQRVIADTIESVRQSGCCVVVVADGCTDRTVELAREKGVFVYEVNECNKGRAINRYLDEAKETIALMTVGITVVDCGTTVDESYAARIRTALLKRPVVQGWLRSSGRESWVNSWYCWLYGAYHLAALGREVLRLPAMIGGTGFAWRPEVAVRFDSRCMVEDMELGVRLHKAGVKVGYVDLGVFDEKPCTLGASLRQRVRWASGCWWLVLHGRGLTWRVDDAAVCFGTVGVLVFSAGTLVMFMRTPLAVWNGVLVYLVLGFIGLCKMRQARKIRLSLLWSIPLMQALELLVNMRGLFAFNQSRWAGTQHWGAGRTSRL
jgi:cellulose synthase/poly-beta-1,6-N-acetylglucosamine synthase-like glycosyltransferase